MDDTYPIGIGACRRAIERARKALNVNYTQETEEINHEQTEIISSLRKVIRLKYDQKHIPFVAFALDRMRKNEER